jgi:hypothetical protein
MVGNDLRLDEGIGTCAKEGQSVPVGVGVDPGHPGPSTPVISPAGASTASSIAIASRAASPAKCSGVLSFRKKSSSTLPPPQQQPALRRF